MKQLSKQFWCGEKGFVLNDLLINVVAIFCVLATVTVPNASNLIDQGKVESHETELQNVLEILADRAQDALDEAATEDN